MRFCNNCENMYYIKLSTDGETLVYYCRNCGDEQTNVTDDLTISSTTFKQPINFNNIINEYTKLDPTLPRTDTIPCPNTKCPTNDKTKSVPKEVIYIKYNETNMEYVYLCSHCDTSWNSINT